MVSCRPRKSIRLPSSPAGPASIQRRSTRESVSSSVCGDAQIADSLRHLQHERQRHPRQDRRPPQDVVLPRRGLLEIEIGGPDFVGASRRERAERDHQAREPAREDFCAPLISESHRRGSSARRRRHWGRSSAAAERLRAAGPASARCIWPACPRRPSSPPFPSGRRARPASRPARSPRRRARGPE